MVHTPEDLGRARKSGQVPPVHPPAGLGPCLGPPAPGRRIGCEYRAAYVETNTLKRHELGIAQGDANGQWRGPNLPHLFDWLLVMTRA